MTLKHNLILIVSTLTLWCCSCMQEDRIDYSTQVKPIINNKCIACHGGVKKQAGFSFLFESEAKAKLKSGKYAIVPGKPGQSEMIRRINHEDPEERMPYEHDPLPKQEIDILTKWIKQGAQWGEHWAYQSIKTHEVPTTGQDWAKNSIDNFVHKKGTELDLKVSPQAAPEILARRVALDIIGFPAPDSITAPFIQSPTDAAYEQMVDRLLSSPHYGEKWTSMWLDLARYADTKGYEKDDGRTIWRYRDWLIQSFNADMPYDQFITEQLAGDLLPNPTDDHYIATAFHRNTMTNDEGGTDNEEFRVAAVIDRVNTTWETLMSTSFACVQCHSHPYDPFHHEDYYKFMTYFNNTRDVDTWADYPYIRHLKPEQKSKLNTLASWLKKNTDTQQVNEIIHFVKTLQPSVNSLESNTYTNSELADTKWLGMRNNSSARIPNFPLNDHGVLILNYTNVIKKGKVQFRLDKMDGPVLAEFTANPTKDWVLIDIPLKPISGNHDIWILFSSPELKDPNQTGILFDYFHPTNKFPEGNTSQTYKKLYWSLLTDPCENTPIMLDNTKSMQRITQVFERGIWLSKRDTVTANVPDNILPFPENTPQNRLGLALWITNKKHPLTSRTIVNRLWEQLWGTGIVETLEDMGSQGALPSHIELLDHLSLRLMHNHHWSLKSLLKEMVTSATYRQDSKATPEQLAMDPTNRYLMRGPRVRLSAEQIRDQSLAACGIMNEELYGPPSMPYQPEGVWLSPYNSEQWIKSPGQGRFKRALYTYWKRTSPYPGMSNFDAMGREVCSSRRIRTNTPLQALTTLNDSAYIELAAYLVDRVGWDHPEENIRKAYRLLTGKNIDDHRATVLHRLFTEALNTYSKTPIQGIRPEQQAMVLVANALMNLDEVITKT